ncbi:MAG: cation-translocating P-type ATPase [Niastella sp.]|nr:cation-translocating P-type ATPase [Niastella sp.]
MDQPAIENGLSSTQVQENRRRYGSNATQQESRAVWIDLILGFLKEPMFLLLLTSCIIYFSVGQAQDGFIMLAALLVVSGISFFQDYRSTNAVKTLNKMAEPRAKVIREGTQQAIPAAEIVTGDIVLLEEGMLIQADGRIRQANDLTVNESILTGESFAIAKTATGDNKVFKGTLVTSGGGRMEVTAVGQHTQFGQIGKSLSEVTVQKTPLQRQIQDFVRKMVIAGIVAFAIVVSYNLYLSGSFNQAFLQGLTLAMSILPEEIPVAFSTFQALGAYRLLKKNIIVKQPQYVETLGAASVICVDKTGTLTQNKMQIVYLYDTATDRSVRIDEQAVLPQQLIEYAMWSSETEPFDPMEKSIHALYAKTATTDQRPHYRQIHEYPLSGIPPMMTHAFRNAAAQTVVATKGAPEAILRNSRLPEDKKEIYLEQSRQYARKGYRVLAVGKAVDGYPEWPENQEDFEFEFLGFVVFEDPIKPGIQDTIRSFLRAGIQVKMITGDYAETARAIAQQAGIDHEAAVLTGQQVMDMPVEQLMQAAKTTDIYVRMFPEAKLKMINTLKAAGEIVAMTGDGVNDAPALKAAHIGVAMGKRGSEVARSAASLILVNDDLRSMTEAIALGRRIYDNLKKAIRYIISIHIPIILIVMLPLLLGWQFTDIFSPVHVIFLELIMGPTCSIIYENEPVEEGTLAKPPRKITFSFLSFRQLVVSIMQGLAITAACLGLGYYYLQSGENTATVRTIIFISLLFSNIFLTQINRSFVHTVFHTFRYKNILIPLISGVTLLFIITLLYVPQVRDLFRLQTLPMPVLITCIVVALAGTAWIEWVKPFTRTNTKPLSAQDNM